MTGNLPNKDSPDLHLVVATPEENLAQTTANSTEWRGALSLDAYLRREKHLLDQDLTRSGGLTAWMLVHQPPDGNKREVLCGCESIKKRALVAKNGLVEEVVAHGVASVFCPPKYRGRGYAGRMMSELGLRLKGWQVDAQDEGGEVKESHAAFSVLYSDIGKHFYAARGWQGFPSGHVALPASSDPSTPDSLPPVRKLESSDLPELCATDERLLRQRLASYTSSSAASRTAVALLPDRATLDWHHARESFVATELHGGTLPPFLRESGRGALVEVSSGVRVWCYWTRVWTNPQEEAPDTLHIIRIAIDSPTLPSSDSFSPASEEGVERVRDSEAVKAIAALLRTAQRTAAASGMQEVQVWNPTSTTLAAARLLDAEAAVVHRESESIASLLWYGEGDWRELEWVGNEKFGWC